MLSITLAVPSATRIQRGSQGIVPVFVSVELFNPDERPLRVIIWYWHKRSLLVRKTLAKVTRNAVLHFLGFDIASHTLAKQHFFCFLSITRLFLDLSKALH